MQRNEVRMAKPSSEKRYDVRQELDASRTAYDIFTGVPVQAGASLAVGMEEEFARYLVDVMNADYRQRRESRNQP